MQSHHVRNPKMVRLHCSCCLKKPIKKNGEGLINLDTLCFNNFTAGSSTVLLCVMCPSSTPQTPGTRVISALHGPPTPLRSLVETSTNPYGVFHKFGAVFGSPCNWDHKISGFILGSHFGNRHMGYSMSNHRIHTYICHYPNDA